MSDYLDLAARIEAIAEEIDDRAFGELSEAVAARAGVRPAADKQLMQARRGARRKPPRHCARSTEFATTDHPDD